MADNFARYGPVIRKTVQECEELLREKIKSDPEVRIAFDKAVKLIRDMNPDNPESQYSGESR